MDENTHTRTRTRIPELRFLEPENLEGISSCSEIPRDRLMLTCACCSKAATPLPSAAAGSLLKKHKASAVSLSAMGAPTGACVQCSKGGCFTAFHVTCGQLAGYHMAMLSGADEDDEVPALAPYCPKHRPRFMWKGHYVDSLKFLEVQDLVPLSLNLSHDTAVSIIREAAQAQLPGGESEGWRQEHEVGEDVAIAVFEHWLCKRRSKGHFLSQHHRVALQDLVAFLPGEFDQHKHKSPFYVKTTTAGATAPSNRRKRPRFSAPRKSTSSFK